MILRAWRAHTLALFRIWFSDSTTLVFEAKGTGWWFADATRSHEKKSKHHWRAMHSRSGVGEAY